MWDDQQLLHRYASEGSDTAFGEIVTRYLNLVYSTALRRTNGDAHRAQDIAQLVFTDLARKAASLPPDVVLPGWLHCATRYAAAQLLRTESRRQAREQEAVAMNALQSLPQPDWDQIAPLLDDALDELNTIDRDAVLLRFFQQLSLAEVGHKIGLTEEAARKRVSRALEKLHEHLRRQGVTTTAAILSVAISGNAISVAPAGLAATITASTTVAVATISSSTAIAASKTIAMTTLQKTIIAAAFIAAVGAGIYQANQASQLRDENDSLQRQLKQLAADNADLTKRISHLAKVKSPHLPAPSMHMSAQPDVLSEQDPQATNIYARFKDKLPKLTAEQVEAFLKAKGRTSPNLLAAYRTSGDPALLKEAMQKSPNDPHVAFEAAISNDLTPEEKSQWIAAFEKAAPNNALGNYLAAINDFKAGQSDQAVQEVVAAESKQQFQDYTTERILDDKEAYLGAGYSPTEAEVLASRSLLLTQLAPLKQLGISLVDMANTYNQSGDTASAQTALQMAMNLGQRYADNSSDPAYIDQLVGKAIETIALKAMDPNAPYGSSGQTVQDQINQISQEKAANSQLIDQVQPILQSMTDQEWDNLTQRRMLFGEIPTLQWLLNTHTPQ